MARVKRADPTRISRIPVSSNRAPLKAEGLDQKNFYYRWVNDIDDRIATFIAAGYEFVEDKNISTGEPTVDSSSTRTLDSRKRKPVGRGIFAYLMRLPIQFWKEDQAAKEREIRAVERSMIRPGKGGPVQNDVDYGKMSLGSRQGEEDVKFHNIEKAPEDALGGEQG